MTKVKGMSNSVSDIERVLAARFVAEHWLHAIMANDDLRGTGMSHPVAMVIAALDGETNPKQLGLSDDVHEAFLAALESANHTIVRKGAVDELADDVRYAGGNGTSDYWRGFNDGIDALRAALEPVGDTEP